MTVFTRQISCFVIWVLSAIFVTAQTVVPYVKQVDNDLTTGKTRIYFGYINTGEDPRSIPLSINNFMLITNEGFLVSFQPTVFLPGHVPTIRALNFIEGGVTNLVEFNLLLDTYYYNGDTMQNELIYGGWSLLGVPATASASNGITFIRNSPASNTNNSTTLPANYTNVYTHTTTSLALPSGRVIIEGGGELVLESGNFDAHTILNRGDGAIRLQGGTLTAASSLTNAALMIMEGGGTIDTPLFHNTGDGRIEIVSGVNAIQGFMNRGQLLIQDGSLSAGHITNQGLLSIQGGALTLSDGMTLGSNGTLRLFSGGVIETTSLVNQGGALDFQGGALRVTDGGFFTGEGGMLGYSPVIGHNTRVEFAQGSALIQDDTLLTITDGSVLAVQGGTNQGDFYVTAAQFSSESGTFRNDTGASLSAVDSVLDFQGGGLLNLGSLTLVRSVVEGDVYSPTGSTVTVGGAATFNGLFSGAANFTGLGDAIFNGGYSPGDSPALVTHEGNVIFGAANWLTMEIGGTLRGIEYDALDIGGILSLNGVMEIVFINGFSAGFGESYQLFDFGSMTGAFSQINLPTLSDGLFWNLSELFINGSIQVIPEPTPKLLLMGIFLLVFLSAFFARKKRAHSQAH